MGFNQRFGLRDLAPDDPTWGEASPATRLAFFRHAGDRMVAIKRGELARAIGANGRRMAARKWPRPDGATGPVLTPHGADSRTARLMAAHATVESVTLFWRSGHSKAQRLPWGTILGFHAAGQVKGAPARDVRLSGKGLRTLKDEMLAWWRENHAPALRKAREGRLAAEEAARRKAMPRPTRAVKRAADAIAKRYRSLAGYLKPRGGGFR